MRRFAAVGVGLGCARVGSDPDPIGSGLECRHAAIDYLGSSATSWTAGVGDSLLRTGWNTGPGAAGRGAAALRQYRALPVGGDTAGAANGVYAGRNPGVVFRFSGCGSGFAALAKTVRQEAGGACGADGADQDDAAIAAQDDGLLPLRYVGSMWAGDIQVGGCDRAGEVAAKAAVVVQFDKEASQTRDYWVAKNATRRAARPDSSLRKERLFGMAITLHHYQSGEAGGKFLAAHLQ